MYAILKILCKLTLSAYFRKINISGKKNIRPQGPFIFVANHPSAFMDPIAIATAVKPPVYFLAAGEYMGKGLKYKIFKSLLHMIPVYRPDTMPGETHKNAAAFGKCIEHLTKGNSILVFPEGVSVTEKKILPIKTGVARIARETELASNKKLNLQVIPIGLNYSDPHTFRSDLYINIGEAIDVKDFVNSETIDEKEEVRNFTQYIEDQMIKTVLHQESIELEILIDKINATYSSDLKTELGVGYGDQEREFELNKLTISAVEHFKESQAESYQEITALLDDYIKIIEKEGIRDQAFRNVNKKTSFIHNLGFIIGAPFFLLGWLGNYIPYKLNVWIQNKLNVKDSFKGSLIFGIGLALFLGWFALWVSMCWVFTPLSYFSLVIPVLLYLSGTFALVYYSSISFILSRIKLRKYLANHPEKSDALKTKRHYLMQRFEEMRMEFDTEAV